MKTKHIFRKTQKQKRKKQTKKLKQKGGRLIGNPNEIGKWLAIPHADATVDEYRKCEARFMNMFPSIPSTDDNLRGLFGILQDHARIIAEFLKLNYAGRRRALKNLENAITLRNAFPTPDQGHRAFLGIEEDLFAALDALPKLSAPMGPQLPTFDDVDMIASDITNLKSYLEQLERGFIPPDLTEADLPTEHTDVHANIERLEKQYRDMHKQPDLFPTIGEAKISTVDETSKSSTADEAASKPLSKKKVPNVLQKAAAAAEDEQALDVAFQTATEGTAFFHSMPTTNLSDILSFRKFAELKPRVENTSTVQFLSDKTYTTFLSNYDENKGVVTAMKEMKAIEKKSLLDPRGIKRHKELTRHVLFFMIKDILEVNFGQRVYQTQHVLHSIQMFYLFTETSPPFFLEQPIVPANLLPILHIFYNAVYLILSQFSKNELSQNYYIIISGFYLGDYLYFFKLFEYVFKKYDSEAITKLKIIVRKCIVNMNSKVNVKPRLVVLFDLPCYTLNESISIQESSPLFHEMMNATAQRIHTISLEERTRIKKIKSDAEKGLVVDLRSLAHDLSVFNLRNITEYLTTFIDNVIPEIKELRKKDKGFFRDKMLLIVKAFLSVFSNTISSLEYYKFDKSQFANFSIIETELELFIKFLRVTIMAQKNGYIDASNEIYFTYVNLYHFMYFYVYTEIGSNKKFESENATIVNATVDYIFDHDL
jgi:hypothetical protein